MQLTMQWLVEGIGTIAQVDAVKLGRKLALHLQVLHKQLLLHRSIVVRKERLTGLCLATLGDAHVQPVGNIPASVLPEDHGCNIVQ